MPEATDAISHYGKRAKPIQIGERFGRLVVIGEAEPGRNPAGHRIRRLLCLCDCGQKRVIKPGTLRYGASKSCGCLQRDVVRARSLTHGHTTGYKAHPLYSSWCNMRSRCRNEADARYSYYGGRGINICEEWFASFAAFLKDMGERPSPHHSVDRIDNNGDYCPGNCRWADKKTQARNTRANRYYIIRGERVGLAELSERTGLNETSIRNRFNNGWPADMLDAPRTKPTEAARRASLARWGKRA